MDKAVKMQQRYDAAFGGKGAVVYKLGHSAALAQVRPPAACCRCE